MSSDPVAAEMVRRGCPFSGLLYAGLAMTSGGPAVVEFNCRFGDPERAVLALLESPQDNCCMPPPPGALVDFGPLRWHDGYAVTVVLAAENYPAGRGWVTSSAAPSRPVFCAGTARRADGAVVSSAASALGGRNRTGSRCGPRCGVPDHVVNPIAGQSFFRTDIALAGAGAVGP